MADDGGTRNVLHMSLGFLFVFFGFSTAQNFVVPLFGNIGSLSLGVLYFVFTFVLLAGPPLMNRVGGPKRAMVIGASGYQITLGQTPSLITGPLGGQNPLEMGLPEGHDDPLASAGYSDSMIVAFFTRPVGQTQVGSL